MAATQWLYMVRPARADMVKEGPTPREMQVIGEHFAYLQRMTAEGVVLVAGRTQNNDERTFGITIFVADGEDAARRVMEGDPAVRAGVMTAELFPYAVATWSAAGPPA